MLKETVEVAEIKNSKVAVKFTRQGSCSSCQASHICNVDKQQTLLVDNPGLNLNKGDKVEVGIEEKRNLLAILIALLIPAGLFVAALIVFKSRGEFMSFFLAMLVLFVYYFIVKVNLKNKGKYFKLQILRKL